MKNLATATFMLVACVARHSGRRGALFHRRSALGWLADTSARYATGEVSLHHHGLLA